MILEVQSENRKMAVEVMEAAGLRRVTVDGQEFPCDCMRLPNGHYSLIIDGRVHDFIVEVSEGKFVSGNGGAFCRASTTVG